MRTMLFQPWALSLSLKLLCFALILKSFFTVFWWLLTVKVTKSLLILFCRLNGNVIAKFLNLSLIIYLKLFFSNSFSHLTGNNKKRYTHLCVCVGGGPKHELEVFFYSGDAWVIIKTWACPEGGHIPWLF